MIGGFGERWNVWPMGSREAGLAGAGRGLQGRGGAGRGGAGRALWLPLRCRLRLNLESVCMPEAENFLALPVLCCGSRLLTSSLSEHIYVTCKAS